MVLLAGAGLTIRTLVHLETLPPGFDASDGQRTAKHPWMTRAFTTRLLSKSCWTIASWPCARSPASSTPPSASASPTAFAE